MSREKKVKEFMNQFTKALEHTSKLEKAIKEKAMQFNTCNAKGDE
tara:strand:- start:188 stop:322 length:135 start_codon:yes stop_codon:yes gene_type:complete